MTGELPEPIQHHYDEVEKINLIKQNNQDVIERHNVGLSLMQLLTYPFLKKGSPEYERIRRICRRVKARDKRLRQNNFRIAMDTGAIESHMPDRIPVFENYLRTNSVIFQNFSLIQEKSQILLGKLSKLSQAVNTSRGWLQGASATELADLLVLNTSMPRSFKGAIDAGLKLISTGASEIAYGKVGDENTLKEEVQTLFEELFLLCQAMKEFEEQVREAKEHLAEVGKTATIGRYGEWADAILDRTGNKGGVSGASLGGHLYGLLTQHGDIKKIEELKEFLEHLIEGAQNTQKAILEEVMRDRKKLPPPSAGT